MLLWFQLSLDAIKISKINIQLKGYYMSNILTMCIFFFNELKQLLLQLFWRFFILNKIVSKILVQKQFCRNWK